MKALLDVGLIAAIILMAHVALAAGKEPHLKSARGTDEEEPCKKTNTSEVARQLRHRGYMGRATNHGSGPRNGVTIPAPTATSKPTLRQEIQKLTGCVLRPGQKGDCGIQAHH